MNYLINQRDALSRFLEDGRLRLDNNLSELELRRQVVGRANWTFCGSDCQRALKPAENETARP